MSGFYGTASFMSPEQILSDFNSEDIDLSSDIYSAGLVFADVLANKHGYNIQDYFHPYFLFSNGDLKDDNLLNLEKS